MIYGTTNLLLCTKAIIYSAAMAASWASLDQNKVQSGRLGKLFSIQAYVVTFSIFSYTIQLHIKELRRALLGHKKLIFYCEA